MFKGQIALTAVRPTAPALAVIVPSPPTNLTATLGAGKLTLTWPASHTGWRLQSQTNLSGTNWSDVIGSMQTNAWIIQVNQAGRSMFFRMTYP